MNRPAQSDVGTPRSVLLVEQAGALVAVFSGDEICRKESGGPTCLARPIARA